MFCKKYRSIAKLYDHTVNEAPIKRDFIDFHKEGVGPEKNEDCNTLESHIAQNEDNNKKLILKMDVEGAEWDVLLQTPIATLELFEQIVIEIHWLHSDGQNYNGKNLLKPIMKKKTDVLKKLNSLFYLYHVHAVNFSPFFYIDRFKLPQALELTFVNKKYFKSAGRSETIFATEADRLSWAKRKDMDLYFWPFYPGIIQHVSNIFTQLGWRGWWIIIVLAFKIFVTKWKSFLIKLNLRRPQSYS